ncbi:unnamed protein product [Callosobruchus maculatus]|uniref:28S ribosomal protein S17, mitochondrial n=1 Tax=Callosobruchus maculatus TaxID=64391 RepID=A0A653BST4_CALMS|nr:unnamed protein product [Callosobruchus maculatus]
MTLQSATRTFMFLGQCVPCVKQGVSKFKVKRLELDENLLKYFPKQEFVYAHDPEKLCKTGDIALLELLPEKLTRLISHKVKKVIYPMGDITDPITGKKVIVGQYRDHIEKVNEVYGRRKDAFDYQKAPQRGWQEDKKDFTHLEIYIKYHESGKDDPAAV